MIGPWNLLGSVVVTDVSSKCVEGKQFEIAASKLSIESDVNELPYLIDQKDLVVSNNGWDLNKQQMEVMVLHPNNSYYKTLPYLDGKFKFDNDESDPDRKRNNEEFNLMVLPLGCYVD